MHHSSRTEYTRKIEDTDNSFTNFFDNATIATVIAAILAIFIGKWIYRHQKLEDRQSDIIQEATQDIVQLLEKMTAVTLVIDRIANSYLESRSKTTEMNEDEFFESSVMSEIPNLSNILNIEIPALHKRIELKLKIYFERNIEARDQFVAFEKDLIKWHNHFISEKKFNLRKRIDDQPELSTDEAAGKAMKLIKMLNG